MCPTDSPPCPAGAPLHEPQALFAKAKVAYSWCCVRCIVAPPSGTTKWQNLKMETWARVQAAAPRRACACRSERQLYSEVSRRGVVLLPALLASSVATAKAARADDCQLQSSPSGLKFCELKEGDGADAQAGTLIRAHYAGKLESNGKQFDSSYDRGRPLTFRVGGGEVIKGSFRTWLTVIDPVLVARMHCSITSVTLQAGTWAYRAPKACRR